MAGLVVISSVVAFAMLVFVASFLTYVRRQASSDQVDRRSHGAALRGLQAMDGMNRVISFTHNDHIAFTRWEASVDGSWHHAHVLARAGWQKTVRCSGNSSMSCEECADNDCWTNGDDTRQVILDEGAPRFKRYLNTIQVRCSSPTIKVDYEVQDLRSGELRFLWDGVDVSQQWSIVAAGLGLPLVSNGNNFAALNAVDARSGSLTIAAEHAGGHTFQVEFVPFAGNSHVKLSKLEVSMPKSFADCEDYKACLDPISGNHELRNNNSLQLSCLIDPEPISSDCGRWRGCLTEERKSQLVVLLRAAGVGGFRFNASSFETVSELNISSPSTHDEAGDNCLNPLVQDPQSWACDCFDEMQHSCAVLAEHVPNETTFTEELCMRAKFCEQSQICSEWKEHACEEDEVQQLQSLLSNDKRRALSYRRGPARAGGGGAFDRALMSKSCL